MSDHEHGQDHQHSWVFYAGILVFLGVITGVELGPLFDVYNIPVLGLLVLSVVKFAVVVAFFMHLWDDASVYTRLFVVPLIGSALMVGVLMVLHYTFNPSPGKDVFPVQERYWTNYNQVCSSWLTSHNSNRKYCASPVISKKRVMRELIGLPTGSFTSEDFDINSLASLEEKEKWLRTRGAEAYATSCQSCHGGQGKGTSTVPPLAGAHEFYGDPEKHARIVAFGFAGPISVLGKNYNGVMPSDFKSWSDADIAAVVSYERINFGNSDGFVMPEVVAAARAKGELSAAELTGGAAPAEHH